MSEINNQNENTLRAIQALNVTAEEAVSLFAKYCTGPRSPRISPQSGEPTVHGQSVDIAANHQAAAPPRVSESVDALFHEIVAGQFTI